MMINMGRLLRYTALRFSEKKVLFNIERNRKFTFWQLQELTNQITNMLRDQFSLVEKDIYATLLENDNMSLLHYWMAKAMSTAFWLSIRDSLQEHLDQLDYVKPKLIFIEAQLLPIYYAHLVQRGIQIISMDKVDDAGKDKYQDVYYFWDLVDKMPASEPEVEYVADDVNKHIYLLRFTGATTGKGKCAMYSLSNLLSAACNSSNYSEVFPYDNPKVLISTPLTHASGAMVLPVYFRGGTIITLNKTDIETICQIVEAEKIEILYTVPTVLYRMLDLNLPEKYDLSSLKTIRYGTQSISPAKLEALIKQFGRIFVQGYAATESWVPCTVLGREEHSFETEEGRKRLNSVGRPVPGVEILIADDNGYEVPLNREGEIWIRGPHTIQGYYNAPKETRENFTKNGFWRSGDIGYIDREGFLYLVDRKKDMIVSGGFNVYAKEVENCLNSHPAVEQSAVVGIPDDYWGEAVHAEVIQKDGATVSEEELIAFCKQRIARYKAPKNITFVKELPLSSVGKVLRRVVRKKYLKNKDGNTLN